MRHYETLMMSFGFVVMAVILPATFTLGDYPLWQPIAVGAAAGLCCGYVLNGDKAELRPLATWIFAGVACASLSYAFLGPLLPGR